MAEDVVWFSEVDRNDVQYVGGKGANLGELYKAKMPVPNGFIVTAQAYFENVKETGAIDRIKGLLFNLDIENPVSLQEKAEACQKEIKEMLLNEKLAKKIDKFYKELSGGRDVYVAVRSSATAEDLPEASFAGQQATFLNILGKKALRRAILDAWASLFEARAIFYRVQQNFDHFKVGIAIPVQIMVQSEVSGIMFTQDPVTNDKDTMIIEAVYGLGEFIVGGLVTPDHYEVKSKDLTISKKEIVVQDKQLVRAKNKNKQNKTLAVSKLYGKLQKLSDEKIVELAKIGKKVEKHYFFPQDLEWAMEDDKLFIVQTRPITTFKKVGEELEKKKAPLVTDSLTPLVIGAPASPAIGTGKVVIIHSPKELFKVKAGDVLVTEMTNPDYVPAMKRAVAIVTDLGGRTSHAAIVSRELGIACVVGTGKATKKLKDGMIVTVDGANGAVYKGSPKMSKKEITQKAHQTDSIHRKTATHVYVNLAEPELAAEVAAKNVDGVGLLRAEFILAAIGTHPKKFIEDGKSEEFTSDLAFKLSIFGRNFDERPVIYRATDLKSNEYRNLKGGEKYEPVEPNPMLGYRGAFRYIKDPDIFKLELAAIKRARVKHKNLHLMIPFVRSVEELKSVKTLVASEGLFEDKTFKFWMMAEIPVNVIMLEEFIEVGIDGVSIGSNDLTMLMLGTDRDNEEVASEFNELNPAVLWALEKIVKTCARNNITCSICGQAPSIYPELTQKLVSWGITSVSVNPDVIDKTRKFIYEAEHKLITKT
ncbi:MAG: phosphoenolpyruvate synthase [Candidatus Curtissbacteria bacterium]|nr:phosphoenolpyruvate synthase [Candidatus Curtissbacteria bacterium]